MAGKFTYNQRELRAAVNRVMATSKRAQVAAMRDASKLFEAEAKLRAPVDEGTLTADITGDVRQNEKSVSARVYVPVNAPSRPYAIPMHEHFYNLGANSQAKQAKVNVVVGRQYISRAITENLDEARQVVISRLRRMLGGGK